MYWFWYFVFAGNPAFLLLGMSGFLGKEAEEAAGDVALMMGTIFCVLVVLAAIGGLIYLILKVIGVV